MFPVEVGGLDADTGLSYSVDSHGSVLGLEPLGCGRSIGKEKVEDDTQSHRDGTQDVEDEFPSRSRVVAHGANTGGHEGTLEMSDCSSGSTHNHSTPTDGRVPNGLSQWDFFSSVPPTGHERESRSDGGFKDTKEKSGNHDVVEVLGPDHDENHQTPDESRDTQDSSGVQSTEEV